MDITNRFFNPHLGEFEDVATRYLENIKKVAKRFIKYKRNYEYFQEDMVQQGYEGLLNAYRNYDPKKYDVKFWTYAEHFVCGQMKDLIKRTTNIIRPSDKVNQLSMKIRKLDLLGNSSEEIAAILGCSNTITKVALSFLRDRTVASLNQKVLDSNNEVGYLELGDVISSNAEDYNKIIVYDFIETLTQSEKQVLILKMDGYNSQEIRKRNGIKLAEIASIEESLIKKYCSYFGIKCKEGDGVELNKLSQKNGSLLTKTEYTKLKESGLSNEEIAKRKKISKSTVNRYSQKWRNEAENKINEDMKDQGLVVTLSESKEIERIRQEMEIAHNENLSLKERLSKLQEEINLLWKMQDLLRSKIWE